MITWVHIHDLDDDGGDDFDGSGEDCDGDDNDDAH